MSQIPPVPDPSPNTRHADSRKLTDRETTHGEYADHHASVRARPVSWHPSTPVEPPLEPRELRPIGVHAMLNPADRALAESVGKPRSRDILDLKSSASPSPRLHPSSSPMAHLAATVPPQQHPNKRLSQSPHARPRRIITPVSPSARFVGASGRHPPYPGKVSVSQSPFVQEQLGELYHTAPGSPLPVEPSLGPSAPLSGHHPSQPPVSLQSTPTFHSRRTSVGPATNPSSQETSPTTPHSTFSQFGRSSPAVGGVGAQPTAPPFLNSSPYSAMESLGRLPSVLGGQRLSGDEGTLMAGNTSDNPPLPGMIPCILDLKSGSSSQAEKRKANSDASRRFRNRKKNELQMEHKINAQQDEIRKQTETIQKQAEEIRALMKEKEFYRSERDFYREHLNRTVPLSQLPARPPSPRLYRSSLGQIHSEPAGELAWHGPEGAVKSAGSALTPAGQPARSGIPPVSAIASAPHGSWSGPPGTYVPASASHLERGIGPDDKQARPMPQYPGP